MTVFLNPLVTVVITESVSMVAVKGTASSVEGCELLNDMDSSPSVVDNF